SSVDACESSTKWEDRLLDVPDRVPRTCALDGSGCRRGRVGFWETTTKGEWMDPVLVTRPPTGAPTDRSRRALVLVTVCLALFLAGSAVSALAGSLPVLVAGRAVQGLGAAGMSPQTLAILGVAFPERRDRARALGIWSGVSGLALVLGPVAGGALAGRWGWQ